MFYVNPFGNLQKYWSSTRVSGDLSVGNEVKKLKQKDMHLKKKKEGEGKRQQGFFQPLPKDKLSETVVNSKAAAIFSLSLFVPFFRNQKAVVFKARYCSTMYLKTASWFDPQLHLSYKVSNYKSHLSLARAMTCRTKEMNSVLKFNCAVLITNETGILDAIVHKAGTSQSYDSSDFSCSNIHSIS